MITRLAYWFVDHPVAAYAVVFLAAVAIVGSLETPPHAPMR